MKRAAAWLTGVRWRQAALLAVVCAAIYLPGLGATGLSMSEGHRAIPAWEMLADARAGEPHWLVPRMFETAYLRKPPGMLWAIAGSTAVLGETELAARLPSALAAAGLVLAVWWFATRWFGSPWGLAAGLAQALLPVTWPSARSAEIESVHLLTTGVAALTAVHVLWRGSRRPWAWAAVGAVASGAMVLTKGPAGAPFVVAGLLAGILMLRPGVPRAMLGVGAVLLGGGAATALVSAAWARLDEPAVRQGVEAFLWEPAALVGIVLVGPAVLVTMLPAALALLFPWGPDARRERAAAAESGDGGEGAPGPDQVARALGVACVASLLVLTLAGVGNPRYGLPLCGLLTPLAAYVARGAWRAWGAGAFVGKRPAIARAVLLGRAWAWPVVLLAAAAVYVGMVEPERRGSSGREVGLALAAHLPDGAEVWADEAIEARPEVLYYARRAAASEGREVRVRWLKPGFRPTEPPPGLLMLVREDELVDELGPLRGRGAFGPLPEVARVGAHKYTFVLVEAGAE